MKKVIATMALAILAIAPAVYAEDVTYVAGMTGVTWGGCKKSVSSAFKKLAGFKSVKIENGDTSGTQKVTVVTDGSAEVSKEDAVTSLGNKASRYVVVNWAKDGAEEAAPAATEEAAKEDAAPTKEDAPETAAAAPGVETTYVAGMTGVTWGGCKNSVSSAFKKLAGFKSVKIENGDTSGTQKVTVVTDGSAAVTKEDAVASLGSKASRYVVKTWAAAES